MKVCKKCRVKVKTDNAFCPLCQNKLTGKNERNVFPYIPTIYKKYFTFFKILLLVSIIISLACIAIDLMINRYHFSVFVVMGFICLFVVLKIALTKRDSVYKTILWQLVILALIAIFWDYFTGWQSWSLSYVLPILCIVGSVSISIMSIILRDYLDDELFYFICIVVIGIIPVIFVFTDIVTNKIPSIISSFLNLVCFFSLVILKYKDVKEELKRRMHF